MSPIADLSYRNYDGPLLPPANRWWAIGLMSIRLAIKKRGFWVWSLLSAYFYIILLAVLYFIDEFTPLPAGQQNPVLKQIVWKDQFLNAFSVSQMLLCIVALLIGVGTIANDNRANALLVYLSKPCTKADYVIGKWIGIFLPLYVASLAPALLFYAYGVMSYRSYGFFSESPWLLPELFAMCAIPGVVHASLCLGVSSMFNQGRLAGATYAGLYFMSLFFTEAMKGISIAAQFKGHEVPALVQKLFYCSIDGMQIGLAKVFLGTDGSNLFPGVQNGPGGRPRFQPHQVPEPSPGFIIPVVLFACGISLLIAWRRVRAVEVVG